MASERRKDPRRKERVTLSAQLIVGEDDDLINWLATLPDGQRSAEIKAAVRYALGLPQMSEISDTPPQAAASAIDIEALRLELADDLVRRIMTDLPAYVANLVRKEMNGQPSAEPQTEPAQQVDAATLDARVKNWKKAKW